MTQSTKDRVITGLIVGFMMILIQTGFSAFTGRWAKGSETNDFVNEEDYIKNREVDLNKAFTYTDDKIIDFKETHAKDHANIQLQVNQIEKLQAIQITNIQKNIKEIKDMINNLKK